MNKVILILVDGMRPDGFLSCGNPYIHEMMHHWFYTLNGQTVMPSVTLPCHMSLFHSVPPVRHGITTNVYVPMVRPLNGLFEQISNMGATASMFYSWEPLRDIARPGSLTYSEFVHIRSCDHTDVLLTDHTLAHIKEHKPDFLFLYLGETDEKGGHDSGWMSRDYLQRISTAVDCIHRVVDACANEYTVIVTADHGGHDRNHGTDLPEDMTIPMFFFGPAFEPGKQFQGSILDLAPTITALMKIPPAKEWEGHSLI